MLTVRRVSRTYARFTGTRGNASLQATAVEAVTPPPAPTPVTAPKPKSSSTSPKTEAPTSSDAAEGTQENGKQTKWEWPTHRPRINLEHPREWNRPIGKGVLPAYDLALQYIRADSLALKSELKELQDTLRAAEDLSDEEKDMAALDSMREKARILETQSEINLPDVRWKAWNGMADMNKAVYRHLMEQRWKEDGALDLLMERIHQMNVVPDLLPSLHPSLDLRVNFPEPPPKNVYLRSRVKRRYKKVEPGIFLLPEQTWRQPMLYTTVFHTDTRLYTLLMVDLDVPDPDKQSFQTYLHWMQ
ncbi:hypothetical protein AcV7_000123 [Taiwanofungus camphoratus]|nr:hypothetical protein AcV7_000123 [Antrodia cinnamomea]